MHEFDLTDPDQRNEAAAQYVLGTLEPDEKARFEALMAVSHDLQDEVEQWREQLDIFNTSLPPVEPPAGLWQRIDAETAPKGRGIPWLWQSLTGFALVALLAVGLLLWPQPPANVYVHLVKNEQQQPGWIIRTALESDQLVVRSLRPVQMPDNTFYEVWAMQEGYEPMTLGFLPADGERRIEIPPELQARLKHCEIVVTMEGPEGAPSGYQMGPISDKARWRPVQL